MWIDKLPFSSSISQAHLSSWLWGLKPALSFSKSEPLTARSKGAVRGFFMGFTNLRSYVFERHLSQNSSSSSTLLSTLLSDIIPEFESHNILAVILIQIVRLVAGSSYVPRCLSDRT